MSNRVLLESIVTKIGNGVDAEQIDQPSNGMLPISRIETIWDGVIDFERVKYAQVTKAEIDKYALQSGDILFSHINSPAHIGKTAIYRSDQTLIHGINLLLIRVDQKKCYPEYLNYYFKSKNVRALFRARCKKAVNQASLNQPDILELEIPLPPLTEQKRIASLLARADRLRQLRRTAHDLGDALLQSVFLEMFGDPTSNDKHWDQANIKELGKVVTGSTPPSESEGMFGGSIPFITPGDLTVDTLKSQRYVTEEGAKKSRVVRAGSTLVCCIGATIGKTDIAKTKCAFNQQINAIEWNENINDDFGLTMMKFFSRIVAERGISTTLPILKKSEFEDIVVPIPPVNLQEQFSQLSKRTERLKSRHVETGRQVEILFESLLSQAFESHV